MLTISEQLGQIRILSQGSFPLYLKKDYRIRTIHSSLAIEQNSLSLEQVTAIIEGKRILASPLEIKEVINANATYEMNLDPYSIDDMLLAHKSMMHELIPENGRFRSNDVGVFNGETLIHLAPPADMVPGLIQDLFSWYKVSNIHPLIRSAIFHYEVKFIHPFSDGNGRMGRLWHSLLLGKWNEIFYWLPVEDLIRTRQQEYYNALGKSDSDADSSTFVEFLLEVIKDTLQKTTVVGEDKGNEEIDPLFNKLRNAMGKDVLSANEIMDRLGLSHRPTFRQNYLYPALRHGLIEMTIPDKPT